jgi:Icc-related predicted phosphoesterase
VRIVAISDTHTFENDITVPDGDVLIHAGDATINGTLDEVEQFAEWLEAQPHRYKIVVAGNHDWLFERSPQVARSFVKDIAFYAQDTLWEINGVTFYGSPWQPRFMDWAFNVDRGAAIKQKWDQIPQCDVLITHGPPWGVLDYVRLGNEHLGCEELLEAVRRVRPKVHVFGHIHGGYGEATIAGIKFVNASICDEAYRPVNAPIVFELGGRRRSSNERAR